MDEIREHGTNVTISGAGIAALVAVEGIDSDLRAIGIVTITVTAMLLSTALRVIRLRRS